MGKKRSSQPTEVELQILRILWELGPSPVREVHKRLSADKGTNYSTTVKMLTGQLHPSRGNIRILGMDHTHVTFRFTNRTADAWRTM